MNNTGLQKQIGEKIALLRKEKSIKAATMAKHLGKSVSAYSHIENGKVDLKISTIESILTFLQADSDRFFNFNDDSVIAMKSKLVEDHLFEINNLNRVIEILVCRNEYLTEHVLPINPLRVAHKGK